MKGAWAISIVPALLFCGATVAQDVRGLEVCTAEKDMARRTSCLQANVEFLQQELTRQTRRARDDNAAAAKELAALKADVAALKTSLARAHDEIAALKKPAEKK